MASACCAAPSSSDASSTVVVFASAFAIGTVLERLRAQPGLCSSERWRTIGATSSSASCCAAEARAGSVFLIGDGDGLSLGVPVFFADSSLPVSATAWACARGEGLGSRARRGEREGGAGDAL